MMKIRIALGIAAGIYAMAWIQLASAETLNITLANITEANGLVMLEVFAAEEEFKGEQPAVASISQRAQTTAMNFSINLPKGEYGIRVMHDVNGNGELDANFVGMPTEPWAFSNNATGNFGPPKWSEVRFELDGATNQHINLNK
ncbi:MAG: DUF2141 domain-containing protein [Gammaproteobacteria bacterium]|nr:DUF2141 domain-containing protein [Gammaproteobacteria bacterium]